MNQASLLIKIPVDLKESIRAEASALDMTMTGYLMMLHKRSRIEMGHVKIKTAVTLEELEEDGNKAVKKFVFWVKFRKRFKKLAKNLSKKRIIDSYKMMSGKAIVRAFVYTIGELDKMGEEDMWRYTELKEELLKRVGD